MWRADEARDPDAQRVAWGRDFDIAQTLVEPSVAAGQNGPMAALAMLLIKSIANLETVRLVNA
jgi:hypothetical protein